MGLFRRHRDHDAIDLLQRDHRRIEALCAQYRESDSAQARGAVARRLSLELAVHAELEEALLYPRLRAVDAALAPDVDEAYVEHLAHRHLLADLARLPAEDPLHGAMMRVLCGQLGAHLRDEERRLFPAARRSGLDLGALALEMQALEQMLRDRGFDVAAAQPHTARKERATGAGTRRPGRARSTRDSRARAQRA